MLRRRQKVNHALEEHLGRYGALVKDLSAIEEGVLRFKSKLLAVSEIAAQYYCEKKVELRRIHGEEETPQIKEGKVAHDLLLNVQCMNFCPNSVQQFMSAFTRNGWMVKHGEGDYGHKSESRLVLHRRHKIDR